MYKFDKKFVHFMWDDCLDEKTVFYADSIADLENVVSYNRQQNRGTIYKSGNGTFPFEVWPFGTGDMFRFCYYDPHYNFKLAYEQGKVIQYRDGYGNWTDMDSCECVDGMEYRIKPDEQNTVTKRELARWLAQGNGECCPIMDVGSGCVGECTTHYHYEDKHRDNPLAEYIHIRKWGDTEWHNPTREYMGLAE